MLNICFPDHVSLEPSVLKEFSLFLFPPWFDSASRVFSQHCQIFMVKMFFQMHSYVNSNILFFCTLFSYYVYGLIWGGGMELEIRMSNA